jgi:RHS repeat-associated protein
VSGDVIRYDQPFGKDTELSFQVSEYGLKEDIILTAAPAADANLEYRFPLALEGFTARQNASGTVSFLDASGVEQWVIPLGVAYEKSSLTNGLPTVTGSVKISVESSSNGTQEIVVRPDAKWLRDPARKYPVVIDPTITPGYQNATYAFNQISSGSPSSFFSPCGGQGTSACFGPLNGASPSIALFNFDVSPVVGKTIVSAQLQLGLTCAAGATVTIRPLGSAYDRASVVWNTRPSPRAEQIVFSPGQTPGVFGGYTIDIAPWMTKIASTEWAPYGWSLESTAFCETQATGSLATYLIIDYTDPGAGTNRAPINLQSLSPVDGSTVSAPVILSASALDPDGDRLQFLFQGCKVPCATSGVSFDSGWLPASQTSWPLSAASVVGESWQYWSFTSDSISPYIYNGAKQFTVGAAVAVTPQESWAWGMSAAYASTSADIQPDAAINTGTGRLVFGVTDAQVASAGPPLAVTRTYNSGDAGVGAFGTGWASMLDARVDADGTGNLTFRLPDGRVEYHPLVNGLYRTEPGYWSTANVDPAGGWTLLEKDGSLWRFATNGKIVGVNDRNGRGLTVSSDPLYINDVATGKPLQLLSRGAGNAWRRLKLTWTGNLITAVTDDLNQTWNYVYTGNLLTKVCDPRNNNVSTGLCTTYTYDASSRISAVTKPRGNKNFEVGYYADGTVNWRKDGMGNQTTFAYNVGTRTSTTTDPLGRVTTEQYDGLRRLVSRTLPGDANIPQMTVSYSYDSNGYLSKEISPNGTKSILNDFHGNPLQVTDESGATAFYTYDSRDLMIAYVAPEIRATPNLTKRWTYGYDTYGNKVRETNPLDWSRTWSYSNGLTGSPNGLMTIETDWNGNAIQYAYTSMGDVASIVYPGTVSENVTYTYDVLGRKLTETGRLAAPGITYTYDALNAPLTVTEPPATNAVTAIVHRRRVTYTYDANHLKVNELQEDIGGAVSPDPSRSTTWAVDNNDRETGVTDAAGGVTSQTYSATGKVATQTNARGVTQQNTYNARDLLQSITLLNYVDPTVATASAAKVLEQRSYSSVGNMTSSTDALGRVRSYQYTALNQLNRQVLNAFTDRTGAGRAIVEANLTYDTYGNVIAEQRGLGDAAGITVNGSLVTYHYFDLFGRLVGNGYVERGGIIRIDAFTLDRNGNVTRFDRQTKTPSTNPVTMYSKIVTFDARNRPTSVKIPIGSPITDRTATTSYTSAGAIATSTDARGNVIINTFDALGRIIFQTSPSVSNEDVGGVAVAAQIFTTTGYDTYGNATQTKDGLGRVTTVAFDKLNRQIRVDYPNCPTGCTSAAAFVTTIYDPVGNVTRQTDRRGKVTDFEYDALNRNVRITLPQVGTTPRATRIAHYDLRGNVLDTTSEIGSTSSATYNSLDLVKTSTVNDRFPTLSATTTFDYNDLGQMIWKQDPLLHASTFEYEPTGEQLRMTDAVGAIWDTKYDGLGRKIQSIDPLGRSVAVTYNGANEAIAMQRKDAAGTVVSTSSTSFDYNGNRVAETNARGFTTNYVYDAVNRLTSVQQPVTTTTSITTSIGYDRAGNQTRITDGRGKVTTYTYNARNEQTATIEPPTTAQPALADRQFTTTYDPGGLPVTETQPGVTITRTFNELGFLTLEAGTATAPTPAAARTFNRDMLGRLTSITDGTAVQNFSYNDRNALVGSAGWAGNVTFAYDAQLNMTSRLNATITIPQTFTYNAVDQLATEDDGQIPLPTKTIARNLSGQVTQVTQGTAKRTLGYDNIGRLITDEIANNATNLSLNKFTYGYDVNDNVTFKTQTLTGATWAGTNTYTYDQADRLSTWLKPGATVPSTYTYDNAGNLTAWAGSTATFDDRNRMLTSTGATFAWTGRGTMSQQTVGTVTSTFTYDALGRQTGANGGGVNRTFTYDSLDRARQRSEGGVVKQTFAYDGFETDASFVTEGTAVTTNFHTPDGSLSATRSGTSTVAASVDSHGDATLFYNPTIGALTDAKGFDPYGNPVGTLKIGAGAAQGKSFGFQSQWTDPVSGDVDMNARWYNPAANSFRARDSHGGSATSPITLNRYAYGGNNPLKYSDPTGHDMFDLQSIINGVTAATPTATPAASADPLQAAIDAVITPTAPVTIATVSPSAGVSSVTTDFANGSTSLDALLQTAINAAIPATTEQTGNLSYSTDSATAAAAIALVTNAASAANTVASITDNYNATSTPTPTLDQLIATVTSPQAVSNVATVITQIINDVQNVTITQTTTQTSSTPETNATVTATDPAGTPTTTETEAPPPPTDTATGTGSSECTADDNPFCGASDFDPAAGLKNFKDGNQRKDCFFGFDCLLEAEVAAALGVVFIAGIWYYCSNNCTITLGPILNNDPVEARSDTGKNSQKGDGGRRRATLAPVINELENQLERLNRTQGSKKDKDAIKAKIKNLKKEGDDAARGVNHSNTGKR